ncbi:MAG: nucleotide exchange factor GrpE [Capsulimonadales bacterium]|nr:nucleotide exchange factor GrpE [Capsulimonadales bacterium]
MTTEETIAPDDDSSSPETNDTGTDGTEIAALTAQLDEANRKATELNEARLRALADYANLKRRSEEERENLRQFVAEDLIKRLLPIVDNFERALNASEQTREYEKLIGGVQAVYRQLQEYLAREGVQAIEAVNQPFDPNVHNAVLREEDSDHPENTVTEELQKGYLLNGRVLRPTMVKVRV